MADATKAAGAAPADRVTLLFEGARRRVRDIVTPEGVALRVEVATRSERFLAFFLDMIFWMLATALLYTAIVLAVVKGLANDVTATLVLFLAFLIRLLYFIHFELAWRGRTPGKRIMGLRVIDRAGGALNASAIVARNLVREVEIFLPIGIFFSLALTHGMDTWQRLSTLGWIFAIAALPFFNRDHLRAGDLIAGTMVISMPKRILADDLTGASDMHDDAFSFTPQQLRAYGAFELQVLEELLRQKPSKDRVKLYADIVGKIHRRIGWSQTIADADHERFLRAFYKAERADLEREQLFGRGRADKEAGAKGTTRRPA